MQQSKYPRFESTMWGDIPISTIETQTLVLQPVAPETNTTNVFIVENLAGTQTATINGNGDIIAKTITTGDKTTNSRSGTNNNLLGGDNNTLTSTNSFMAGTEGSTISSSGVDNVIVGGDTQSIITTSSKCGIFAGDHNSISAASLESVIIGGYFNTMSGDDCCITAGVSNNVQSTAVASSINGGRENVMTSNYSSIRGGWGAKCTNHGEDAYSGGGFFSVAGDSQQSVYILRNAGLAAGTNYTMYLDYPSNTLEIDLGGTNARGFLELFLFASRTTLNQSSYTIQRYFFQCSTGILTAMAGNTAFASIGGGVLAVVAPELAAYNPYIIGNTTFRLIVGSNTANSLIMARVVVTRLIF